MTVPLTLAGVVFDEADAVENLAGYARDLTLTVEHFDFGPSSGPDRVGPAEIGRLIVIEPLYHSVARELIEKGNAAPWGLVPVDATLADAGPEGDLYWEATTLYRFFDDFDKVGDAIASKLLHLKRPTFFPILDSKLTTFYDPAAMLAYEASERGRRELPEADRLWWAAMHDDLADPDNQKALGAIRRDLRAHEDSLVKRLAQLSSVRLIDMLIWKHS